jgi:hypothetical protein
MKEPIFEYLEYTEPENKYENMMGSDNDPGVDMKKLALDRKQTLQQWKTKVKSTDEVKSEKKIH